jgi:hypothetical protein
LDGPAATKLKKVSGVFVNLSKLSGLFIGLIFCGSSVGFCVETVTPISKIILVVLENTSYDEALRQPFFSKLATNGALLTNYYAVSHPSQPNYVAMIAGSTMGTSNDSNVDLRGSHLGDLLEAHQKSWHAYAEQFPGNCFSGSKKNGYVRKHLPFMSFTNVQNDARRCSNITNAAHFSDDFKKNRLADFSMYIPDLNNDGHDTGAEYADQAMSALFGPLIFGKAATDGQLDMPSDYLLIVTFDEDDFFGGNHIYTVVVGAQVGAGKKLTARYNHYSLLKTIEDVFGLGNIGREDAKASTILGLFTTHSP